MIKQTQKNVENNTRITKFNFIFTVIDDPEKSEVRWQSSILFLKLFSWCPRRSILNSHFFDYWTKLIKRYFFSSI